MDGEPHCHQSSIENMQLGGKIDEKIVNLQDFFIFFHFFCIFSNFFDFWLPQRLKSNAKSTQKLTYGYSERILRLKTKFEASIKKMHMPACGWSNFGFLTSVPWCGYFWKFFAIFRLKTNKYMAWGFQNGIMDPNRTFCWGVIANNRKMMNIWFYPFLPHHLTPQPENGFWMAQTDTANMVIVFKRLHIGH